MPKLVFVDYFFEATCYFLTTIYIYFHLAIRSLSIIMSKQHSKSLTYFQFWSDFVMTMNLTMTPTHITWAPFGVLIYSKCLLNWQLHLLYFAFTLMQSLNSQSTCTSQSSTLSFDDQSCYIISITHFSLG